jgi:lipopolysaccharide export system protein LptC
VIYRGFIVLAFIAVIVGSVLLGGQQREPVSQTAVDDTAGNLGYAVRQARVIETGEDGQPLYTLDAALINQPPGQTSRIELQQVQMAFRDANGREWTGRADSGETTTDVARVELWGDVQVSGSLPGSDTPVRINTEKLSVDTHAHTLKTQELVTVTTPDGKMRSKGLAANLNDGIVHLVSNVHGTYTP